MATTFDFRDEDGQSLSDVSVLDTMVTVVDAANLLADYGSSDFLADRGETAGEGDNRTLVDLLVEQIEFADVVVLNKASTATPDQLDAARKIIVGLNPDAKILETDFGRVDLSEVMGTGRFDLAKAETHPLWFKELHGFKEHIPETEEYGIRSFVYRAKRPFDPMKFQAFLNKSWDGVVRAKGFFWLATRPHWVGELSQAGALVRTGKMGLWWAAVPTEQWPQDRQNREMIASFMDPVWGDRRQELVFIGCDPMNEANISAELDACLVKDTKFEPDRWRNLPDPFAPWNRQAA
ncbi:G3E family GTPase [Rhizobium sp. BK491]|nr:G3E family GTPase [Rhizobium sp. BK491]